MGLFYFVRHGETAWNAEGRFSGSTDVPLSDVGRRQAHLLAERFRGMPVAALYTSPLRRALETARVVGEALGLTSMVDARLTELSYGKWEGHTFAEIPHADPAFYQEWERDPARLAPPGGETGVHLLERAMPFLAELAEDYPSGHVVVVCHKTVCRLLACQFLQLPLAEYRSRILMDNAAVNILETDGETWMVKALNDSSHLHQPAILPRGNVGV